jgi:hypothetical protein
MLVFQFRGRNIKKRRNTMQAEDFFRVINEVDFICDDIDDIKDQVNLTKSENHKISQAISSIEKAKSILTELFPNIKSLKEDVRADLQSEFTDIC